MILLDCINVRRILAKLDRNDDLVGKTVLFVTVRNYSFVMHQELFIANILAKMGADVYYLLDDGNLPHWDTKQIHHSDVPFNASKRFRNTIIEFLISNAYKHEKIHKLYLSHFISDNQVKNELSCLDGYDECNCVSSVRRFFECGKFDRENRQHQEYYNKCRRNCAIMKVGIRNIIKNLKPDAVISSHGIYSVWGSAYNVLNNEMHIPIFIYGAHAYGVDATLFTDTLCQTLTKDSDAIDFMINGEFGLSEYQKISKYFLNRRLHLTKDTSIYYSWMDNDKNGVSPIKEKENVPTYCLFTNIVWDGDVAQRDTIFNGMLDNAIYTINKFRDLPYHLYVRIHPAEATLWKDSVKMGDIIRKEIPDIDNISNVHVIDSSQPVDTYKFVLENVDVALVYDGILSMELTAIGCPVISAAATRYANGDYVINPKSIAEYDFYLEHPDECKEFLTKEKVDRMYKFAYWFIYMAGYCFPLYDEKHFGKLEFSKNSRAKIGSVNFERFVDKLKRSINGR